MAMAPKVSVVAVVAAVAFITNSPPQRVSGRDVPRRLLVAAPSTTVSLPLARRVIVPVPPKATPLMFTLPVRMSIAPTMAGLAALKLTVPAPWLVKPAVVVRIDWLKLTVPPRAAFTTKALVPAAMPPVRVV